MIIRLVKTLQSLIFFFFNDTATTEIYTLSLHDALPISLRLRPLHGLVLDEPGPQLVVVQAARATSRTDRKSTRLNSSHSQISYAVFCLKKKKKIINHCWIMTNDDHLSHHHLIKLSMITR